MCEGLNTAIAYFYFDYKDQASQSATSVVASLARQLASQVEELIPDLYTLYKTLRSRGKSPSLEHHFQALVTASTAFKSSFIILDGLDECSIDQRRYILDIIIRLPCQQFQIFTTSRAHLIEIQDFFRGSPSIEIIADPQDIQRFLNKRVNQELPRYQALKSQIVETITVSANGV
jgi:hypothetical protein